jgi:hypothetical protein
MIQLQDTDKMPWGKYKGTPMQDVPASYLHWLWTNERDPVPPTTSARTSARPGKSAVPGRHRSPD